MMRNFIVDDPNFSVIMPGGCNASCDFCFYKYDQNTELDKSAWLEKLKFVVGGLPEKFKQVSITGGEPTLDILNLTKAARILRDRFEKVVLTTNGFGILDLDEIINDRMVDFINVSRHKPYVIGNSRILNTNSGFKTTRQMKAFILKAHKCGIPVTINCVVTKGLDIDSMIDWCRDIDAYAVKFREISSPDQIYDLTTDKELSGYSIINKESSGYV